VFQDKLREFLRTSEDYHPERLLPALEGLPSHFLHEHALLLSKLGRHEEVLTIYVEQASRLGLHLGGQIRSSFTICLLSPPKPRPQATPCSLGPNLTEDYGLL
jgi:hypothetical protein